MGAAVSAAVHSASGSVSGGASGGVSGGVSGVVPPGRAAEWRAGEGRSVKWLRGLSQAAAEWCAREAPREYEWLVEEEEAGEP